MRKEYIIRNEIVYVENMASNLRAMGNDVAADRMEMSLEILYDELKDSVEA